MSKPLDAVKRKSRSLSIRLRPRDMERLLLRAWKEKKTGSQWVREVLLEALSTRSARGR